MHCIFVTDPFAEGVYFFGKSTLVYLPTEPPARFLGDRICLDDSGDGTGRGEYIQGGGGAGGKRGDRREGERNAPLGDLLD